MANRKTILSTDSVNALNTVSILFADNPQVVTRWYEYFDIVSQLSPVNWTQAGHAYLRMLSEMARVLGYRKIDQVGLDKFYSPQGHVDKASFEDRLQAELLRVLENTAKIETTPIVQKMLIANDDVASLKPVIKNEIASN